MPWLYNSKTGDVEHQNEAEYLADAASNIAGWSGLTKLPIPDSDTTAQAVAYVQAQQKAGKLKGAAPTTSNATANQNAENYVASTVPGGSDVVAVGNFLSDLTQVNLWIRVAKMILGGALIIVGISKMTGASNVITQAAEKIPVVPL